MVAIAGQSDRRIYFGLGEDKTINTLEIRWPSRQVQVMHNLPVDQILTIQEPADLPEVASLIPATHETSAMTRSKREPTAAIILPPAERDSLLSSLEKKVRRRPDDLALTSMYRIQCVKLDEHDRSISFLEQIASELPGNRNIRLQLAAAYVDKIPTCGGMAAIVCKGRFATRSLDQIDILVEADNNWWPALYTRGMNHLLCFLKKLKEQMPRGRLKLFLTILSLKPALF